MKRMLDVALVLLAAPVLLPAITFVALLVLVFIGRPVFFVQERPGQGGRPFAMLKFRTMSEGRDIDGNLLTDEKRLSRFGRMLRASSLDELPELWNVLKGDMSLVGPRPLLMEYLQLYSPEQARRHEVRPGITGWAQVNGRNAISWEEKFRLDVWYVDNADLWLDIRILCMTLFKVLRRDGISGEGHSTMSRFEGNSE